MAQVTDSLVAAILNGAGVTRGEIEQLCHAWRDAQRYRWIKDNAGFTDWRGGGISINEIALDIDWKHFDWAKACAALDAAIDLDIASATPTGGTQA